MSENGNEPMELDEIERRLGAMLPSEPGAELRERIDASLAGQRDGGAEPAEVVPGRRVVAWLAVAAAVAIAGLVFVFNQLEIGDGNVPLPAKAPVAGDVPTTNKCETPLDAVAELPTNPSALELRIAIARTPEALDELLDAAAPAPKPGRSTLTPPDYGLADRQRFTSLENLRWPDAQKP